jgi:hypothetical protein
MRGALAVIQIMKKLWTLLLICLAPILSAHQDSYYIYEYNNVKVRFLTGHYFEEINNVKIIGQYAAILSDSIGYDKPILLDFIHDYGYSYNGKTYSYLTFGLEDYEIISYWLPGFDTTFYDTVYHMVPISDTVESIDNIEKEVTTVPQIDGRSKVVLRQFGYHFDITETMKMLNFALTNRPSLERQSITDTLLSYLPNMYYKFESIPSHIIDSITSASSQYVDKILQHKVYRDVDTINPYSLYFSYFSRNGKFEIFAGLGDTIVILDTLDKVYTFYPRKVFPEILFVFETPNQFRKYNFKSWPFSELKAQKSKQHTIPIDPYESIYMISVEYLGDDIYLINYNYAFMYSGSFARFPYLADDDVLIKDFEQFINSYRKENE